MGAAEALSRCVAGHAEEQHCCLPSEIGHWVLSPNHSLVLVSQVRDLSDQVSQ